MLVLALSLSMAAADPSAESRSPDAGPTESSADAGVPAAPDAGAPPSPEPVAPPFETVVTASRSERRAGEVVVPTEVITRPQIEALGARDLAQLLQQHPGVELIYTNRGVGVRLQGLDPQYVLVLVDGQRVAGRSGTITDLMRFSLREVERVELVKGPAAAMYGADAIAGVVNLITRRPQNPLEGSVRGAFGTLLEGDLRGYLGSKLGPWELRGGGGYRTRNPYDWDPKDVALSGPGLRRLDGDVDLAYRPSEALHLWARTAYVFTDLNAVDLNDSGAVFDRFQRTEQYDAWLGARGRPLEGNVTTARAHFGLFRDQFLVDQRGSRALDEYSQNLTRLFEGYVQSDQRVGDHLLTAGVEGLQETLLSSRLEPSLVRRHRGGAFAQDTWSVGLGAAWKVVLEPGARVDFDSQFGSAVSPRVALKADPHRAVTARASWGLGFRPPSFSELYLRFSNAGIGYIVQGNPALKAELSSSFNLSVDWRLPLEGWLVSAAAWHTGMTNLINITADGVPNPDEPVVFGYENVAQAYSRGAEVSLRVRLSRGTSVELGYTGIDAWDVTRKRPLEGRSAHRVSLQLGARYRPLGLEAALRASWASPRPYYVGQGLGFANVLGLGDEGVVHAPAYGDLEAQLTYRVRDWLKVFVNGYNLLNSGDQNFHPRPPRGVLGGVTLER